ncbi:hypothetical protein Tco_1080997 [Tanacetum coccineum]|uniref:DUF4283 domain-containing protein n=1 Tax=Tanacetum coccineum TaxID=301880 RepID=A0ABQ5HYA9_9ASTR
MVTGWSYARVLVEVDAAKGLVDYVEIWYKSLGKSMVLNVEYVWRPSLCDHCKTFGHFSKFCGKAQVGMDKEIRGEVKQRSFNGYNGRGNMGYRGRDMYNNKGSNSFVSNEVKENVSKYVPVKNKEKVVNVDECLVTDEVLKSKPSSGADKLNKDDAVKDDLGKRGCNGKSTGVLLVVIHGVPIAEWGLLDCWSDDMIHLYKKKSASGTRSIADKRLSESLRSDESCGTIIYDEFDKFTSEPGESIHSYYLRYAKLINDMNMIPMSMSNMQINTKFVNHLFLGKGFPREIDIKVKELQWDKRRFEVDLFMMSKKVLSDDVKQAWTDDMEEYFLDRCEEIKNDERNGHYADNDDCFNMDEVHEDTSGSASFIVQNEVFSGIDVSMAQMQAGLVEHSSSFQ